MVSAGTVLVVDDNDDFRHSVAWMIRGEGYETVEFTSARTAIRALKLATESDLRRSCLLLDVRMPGINGLEFHELLHEESITVPVIYMTGHADVSLAVEAMKLGAVTFLEKPLDLCELNEALQAALAPSRNPSESQRWGISVSDGLDERVEARLQTLTPREHDVLRGIVDGGANKRIAADLGISVRTVEVHRARLMKKLGVRNASELVRLVLTSRVEEP